MANDQTTQFRRGSIVLVRFPFTDLSGSKVRPAIILTPTAALEGMPDILCAFISSRLPSPLLNSDLVIESTNSGFARTGLKTNSVLRAHKIALLKKELVISKLGDFSPALQKQIDRCLLEALGLKQRK